jgi:hypothetical protein
LLILNPQLEVGENSWIHGLEPETRMLQSGAALGQTRYGDDQLDEVVPNGFSLIRTHS